MEPQKRSYPLIVTLELDTEQKGYFNALRKTYFPNHANHLEAHLTMFHHLPSGNEFVMHVLQDYANRAIFPLEVSHLVNFGKGVAFQLYSAELQQIHSEMQQALSQFLKRHDLKPIWPHITIQNKVTSFKAQQTLDFLKDSFEPFEINAIGFGIWYYIGGPWRPARFIPFT